MLKKIVAVAFAIIIIILTGIGVYKWDIDLPEAMDIVIEQTEVIDSNLPLNEKEDGGNDNSVHSR